MDFATCFPDAFKRIEELERRMDEDVVTATKLEEANNKILGDMQAEFKQGDDDLLAKIEQKLNELEEKLSSHITKFEELHLDDVIEKGKATDGEVATALQDIVEFRKNIGEHQTTLADTQARVNTAVQQVDSFRETVSRLESSCNRTAEFRTECENKVSTFEAAVVRVEKSHETIKSTCADRHERRWNEVSEALEDIKSSHASGLEKELLKRNDQMKSETKNLISCALEIVAKVSGERRRNQQRQDLLVAWKNQSLIASRRRLGETLLRRLRDRIEGRAMEEIFSRWNITTKTELLVKNLRSEYEAKVPNVLGIIEEAGLPKAIGAVTQQTKDLSDSTYKKEEVDTIIGDLNEKLEALQGILKRLEGHDEDVHELKNKADGGDVKIKELSERLQDIVMQRISVLETKLKTDVAHANEVQGMMKDVLLLWNSIRQVESMKANQKDLDAALLESSNREKIQIQHLDELKKICEDPAGKLDGLTQNYEDLVDKVNDNANQFKNLQGMMGSLATFVEDLVAKIAENQGMEHSRIIPVRTGGGYRTSSPTRGGGEPLIRYDWPPRTMGSSASASTTAHSTATPGGGYRRSPSPEAVLRFRRDDGHGGQDQSAHRGSQPSFTREDEGYGQDFDQYPTIVPQNEGGRVELESWLKYARGVVDSTIDSSISNEHRKPPSRPRSANTRLPLVEDDGDNSLSGVSGFRMPGISAPAPPKLYKSSGGSNWRNQPTGNSVRKGTTLSRKIQSSNSARN